MKKLFQILTLFLLIFSTKAEYLVMDDESESFLTEIVNNIKDALGFEGEIKVYISSDQTINASAIQSGDIIVNAGAIIQSSNYQELIAILAHEVGHIAGQHIQLFLAHRKDFMKAGLVTTLIGAAAAICTGSAAPFMAGVAGGQSMSQGMALSKLRQKESIADTKAAEAIIKLGWPVFEGFISMHKKLAAGAFAYNEYLSTHPHSSKRIAKYQQYLAESKGKTQSEKIESLMKKYSIAFEIIKHKLHALTIQTELLKDLYKNPKDLNERYARAVALYRLGKHADAIKMIEGLPDSDAEQLAYFSEIKCMSLISLKRCDEAATLAKKMLQNTRKLRNHRDLVVIYAEAVIAGNLSSHIAFATKYLQRILAPKDDDLSALYELGKLYSMAGQDHKASWCAAQSAFVMGDIKMAKIHAKRAFSSPDPIIRQKAQDILNSVEEAEKEDE